MECWNKPEPRLTEPGSRTSPKKHPACPIALPKYPEPGAAAAAGFRRLLPKVRSHRNSREDGELPAGHEGFLGIPRPLHRLRGWHRWLLGHREGDGAPCPSHLTPILPNTCPAPGKTLESCESPRARADKFGEIPRSQAAPAEPPADKVIDPRTDQ